MMAASYYGLTESANAPATPMDGDEIIDDVLDRELIAEWVQSRNGSKLHLPHPYNPERPWCGRQGKFTTTPIGSNVHLFHDLCGYCKNAWNQDGYPHEEVQPILTDGERTQQGEVNGTEAD